MLDMWYVAGDPDAGRATFLFNQNNNRINNGDIRDYSWTYDEQFGKVKQFRKKLATRSIDIIFFQRRSGKENELYSYADDMYAIFDRDVMSNKHGRLFVGKYDKTDESSENKGDYGNGYYIDCFIMASKKDEYDNGVVIKTKLTVLSDFRWHCKLKKEFGKIAGVEPGGDPSDYDYLDFQYDHSYDFSVGVGMNDLRKFAVGAIAAFNFRIEFEGPIEDPELIVGETPPYYWEYRVYASVAEGEKLIIDSLEKKVYRLLPDGTEISEFNARDRDWYIFQPMPIKNQNSRVVWPVGHTVTIYAYLERSEPPWVYDKDGTKYI